MILLIHLIPLLLIGYGGTCATRGTHDIIASMPLSVVQKQDIIKQYQTSGSDTGSPEVQIALLSNRVNRLADHLKEHIHDVHSRRGLLSMIAKRRRLINFLAKVDEARANDILKKIGLK